VVEIADAPVDLAFFDGMHLAEFALRNFANVEVSASGGARSRS
jgi:hypothetical protein